MIMKSRLDQSIYHYPYLELFGSPKVYKTHISTAMFFSPPVDLCTLGVFTKWNIRFNKYTDKCELLKAKHLFSRWLTGRRAFRQGTISKLILDSPLSMMFSPCKEINLTNTAQRPAKAVKQLRNYERMISQSFRRALKIHKFLLLQLSIYETKIDYF